MEVFRPQQHLASLPLAKVAFNEFRESRETHGYRSGAPKKSQIP